VRCAIAPALNGELLRLPSLGNRAASTQELAVRLQGLWGA